MKKFFKYGCGCLVMIIGLIVLFFVSITSCDSSSVSSKQATAVPNNNSGENLNGVDYESDFPLISWEKQEAQEFLQESARKYVKGFLKQKGIKEGFDQKTKLACIVGTVTFSEGEYRSIKLFRKKIELKAFMRWLDALSSLAHEEFETDSGGNKVKSVTKIKWGDFDFEREAILHDTERLSLKYVLVRNGKNLITYTQNQTSKQFAVQNMTMRGVAAYDELIRNFLEHHPNAVKLEYSAWSYDKNKKRGEFALAMVVNLGIFQEEK